jgi:molybdopterin molybdotransferase
MTTYEQAVNIILKNVGPLPAEEKPLFDALGQVLADDVFCEADVPRTDRSRPDGYAVRAEDIERAAPDRPVSLRVMGTVKAGSIPRQTIGPGTAMRIMTGSMMPEGADCVVPFEETDEPGEKNGPNPENPGVVKIFAPARKGVNVGKAGFNAAMGSRVLTRGTVIGPAQLSALATLGKTRVRVIRRPVVAIITTGDELVELGYRLSPAQVYNSNASAVAALVAHFGGVPRVLGTAKDRESSLSSKLRQAGWADAIITTGGVSKGDYDIVRLLLGKKGEILFSRIDMGPGASVAFAMIKDLSDSSPSSRIPVFALSGPPAGALTNCETLVRPGLFRMRGIEETAHPAVDAEVVDGVAQKVPKTFVRWTRLTRTGTEYKVRLNPTDGKDPLATMASANSLTIIPKNVSVEPGDRMEVLPLDWAGLP